jgi:hypothetical protein
MRRDSVFCKSIIKHSCCLLFGDLVCRQHHWSWDYINSGCFPIDHGNIGAQMPYSRNFSIDTRIHLSTTCMSHVSHCLHPLYLVSVPLHLQIKILAYFILIHVFTCHWFILNDPHKNNLYIYIYAIEFQVLH